jgi:hypothetical protein
MQDARERGRTPLELGCAVALLASAALLRLAAIFHLVMDPKGEAIFRRRPVRYAYEEVTRARMARGLILDDGPERLLATRACVAANDLKRFPDRSRVYLEQNYLPVGRLRVAGTLLGAFTTRRGAGPLGAEARPGGCMAGRREARQSQPSSATIVPAVRRATPGMVSSRASASASAVVSVAIRRSQVAKREAGISDPEAQGGGQTRP